MSATESGKVTGGMSVRRQLESTPPNPYPAPEASGTYVALLMVRSCNTCLRPIRTRFRHLAFYVVVRNWIFYVI